MKGKNYYNNCVIIYKMIIYNLRIIFANKFIWFLAGSILFYIGLSIIYVFSNDVSKMEDLYGIFLFSGVLLVFYPSVFGFRMIRMPVQLKYYSEYPITGTKSGW